MPPALSRSAWRSNRKPRRRDDILGKPQGRGAFASSVSIISPINLIGQGFRYIHAGDDKHRCRSFPVAGLHGMALRRSISPSRAEQARDATEMRDCL